MHKKVLISLPPGLLERIDLVAQCEHRTRSDLVRESLRRYIDNFKQQNAPRSSAPASGFGASTDGFRIFETVPE